MDVKWKIFRDSFPYVCTDCGEFATSQGEYCEKCGEKGGLRPTVREDYEKYVEEAKSKVSTVKSEDASKKDGIDLRKERRNKTIKMILIIFCAFIVIDIIGFVILMNILGIPFAEFGENLWVFFGLVGFSLVMFIIIVLGIYFAYYTRDIAPYIPF